MVRRCLDVTLATLALAAAAPLLAAISVGIRVASPGPVLFRAPRVGRGGRVFTMYKFRTMHIGSNRGSPITGSGDARVFGLGRRLRQLKLDELPQLINVLKGDMAIVGPRPEDPRIVQDCYSPEDYETLDVLPGLASPGSIYNYTHGERGLVGEDVAAAYVQRLLPLKLQLDRVYVRNASLAYDARIVARTIRVLIQRAAGRTHFDDPPEMRQRHSAPLRVPAIRP